MNETRLLIQLMNRSDMLRFVEVRSSLYQNTISYLNWKAASNNRRTLGAIKARSQQYTLLFSPLLSSPLTSQFLFPPVCLSSLPFLSKLHLAHITRHATLPPSPPSPSGSDSVLSRALIFQRAIEVVKARQKCSRQAQVMNVIKKMLLEGGCQE